MHVNDHGGQGGIEVGPWGIEEGSPLGLGDEYLIISRSFLTNFTFS